MEKPRVAFIDSNINITYINNLIKDGQSVRGVWRISDDKAIPLTDPLLDTLSHATLCAKIFLDYTLSACDLFFINIWKEEESKANINSLIIALSWCLENKITLINLSLGTTLVSDISVLFSIINILIKKNIIIVAASSNAQKLTFPASFSQVIGVKSLQCKAGEAGFIYHENSIDRIEISCYVKEEVIEFQGNHYPLYAANSLAAPIISAKICNLLMEEGYNSIDKIKMKLKAHSLSLSNNINDNIYQKYFKKTIDIPIIAIINDNINFNIASFIQKILTAFTKQGYQGISLSENNRTNLLHKTLNLTNFTGYSPMESLHFYAHYCNVDYVIVSGSYEYLFKNVEKEIDIILYRVEFENFKGIEKIPSIAFSEYKDFDKLFNQMYNCLSVE